MNQLQNEKLGSLGSSIATCKSSGDIMVGTNNDWTLIVNIILTYLLHENESGGREQHTVLSALYATSLNQGVGLLSPNKLRVNIS